MIFSDLNDYIDETYDKIVREHGGSIRKADTLDMLADRLAAPMARAIIQHEIDSTELARLIANSRLEVLRPRRRSQLKQDIRYIIDYRRDPENAAQSVEPILSSAYPLGTARGEDRTLAFWRIEDLLGASMERYRDAAASTAAAKAFDDTARELIEMMTFSDVRSIGELFALDALGGDVA